MIQAFTFTPLKEFRWYREDLQKLIGIYQVGMTYNCTLEPRHDMLRLKCDEWEAEGMIRTTKLKPDEKFITLEIQDGSST